MSEQTEMIAERFAANLREDLSTKDFAEMVRRNRTPKYANLICASQDFCDANMAMDAAFIEVVGRPLDFGSDDDIAIWNEAWEIARQKYIGEKAS